MALKERDYTQRPEKYIPKVYNKGILEIGDIEKVYDRFKTPINDGEFKAVMKSWYRKLGVTTDDVFYSNADGTTIKGKVAIKGDVDIDIKHHVKIKGEIYAIYRVFYSYFNDETEISLIGGE